MTLKVSTEVRLPAILEHVDAATQIAVDAALTEGMLNVVVPAAKATAASFSKSGRFQESIHASEVESPEPGVFKISLIANPKNEEGKGYGRAVESGSGVPAGRSPYLIEPKGDYALAMADGGFARQAESQGQTGKHVLRDTLKEHKAQLKVLLKEAIKRQLSGR